MSKEELIRQLRVSLAAHKLLMLENYGRPDCKSCALAESVDEILFRAEKPDSHDLIAAKRLREVRRLDYIQAMIWARIKDEADKEGVKLTTSNCYGMGMVIKEVLHPEVAKLLASQRQAIIKEVREGMPVEKVGTVKMPLDAYERGYNIAVQDVNIKLDAMEKKV